MIRLRLSLWVVPLLLQGGCAMPGQPDALKVPVVKREHYDPAYLNAAAVAAAAAGERGTALILLERAVVLAPRDARIARNLALLKLGRLTVGPASEVPVAPAAAAAPGAHASSAIAADIAIWPPK